MKGSGIEYIISRFLKILILLCVSNFTFITFAQTNGGKKISPDLFGLFFEDVNYAADGGLYAELVQNRSFEYNPTEQKEWNPLSFWEYICPGFSIGRFDVETTSPVHPNNPHYIVFDIEHVGHEANYSGDAEAENTLDNPQNIVPIKSVFKVSSNFEYETQAMSLTVIRIKTNN